MKLYNYLWEYRRYNSLTAEQIRSRQAQKLQNLLEHSYKHTQYYRSQFNKVGVSYDDLSDPLTVLKELPILTKKAIARNTDDLFADNIPRDQLFQDSTGGSTGTPLVFYRDRDCLIKRRAQELFFDRWIGYELGDKVALFVASRHHPKGLRGLKSRFRNATSNRILAFDPYRTDTEYIEQFLLQLKKFRPDAIKCFPNSLFIFANYLKEKGVSDIKVRAVSCTGETLHDYQRTLFQEVFQCPVYEKYGTFEVGVAACECSEHNGMHLFLDGVFFEFLASNGQPAKPEEMAKLVVTDLFNYGFPLLRYEIGDVGTYTDRLCPCGSPLPLMSKLHGRDRDILVDSSGNPRPGYLFVEIFNKNHIPGQFQVIQENHKRVLVRAVRKNGYSKDHEKLILDKFKALLGGEVRVEIAYVENIPREQSGKYKYIHSMISPFK